MLPALCASRMDLCQASYSGVASKGQVTRARARFRILWNWAGLASLRVRQGSPGARLDFLNLGWVGNPWSWAGLAGSGAGLASMSPVLKFPQTLQINVNVPNISHRVRSQ